MRRTLLFPAPAPSSSSAGGVRGATQVKGSLAQGPPSAPRSHMREKKPQKTHYNHCSVSTPLALTRLPGPPVLPYFGRAPWAQTRFPGETPGHVHGCGAGHAALAFATHIGKAAPEGTFGPGCTPSSESTPPRSGRQPLGLRLSQNIKDLAGGPSCDLLLLQLAWRRPGPRDTPVPAAGRQRGKGASGTDGILAPGSS